MLSGDTFSFDFRLSEKATMSVPDEPLKVFQPNDAAFLFPPPSYQEVSIFSYH